MSRHSSLPSGTVTFFFSDVEGSTQLVQWWGEDLYRTIIEEHQRVIRDALKANGGVEISTEGDSFFAVFRSALDAVQAAVEGQKSLASGDVPSEVELKVRMGLHTGEGRQGGDNYVGLDVNRGARIAAAGYGGQVLVSEATKTLVVGDLPHGVGVKDLGKHRFKDLLRPERIYQLIIPGLPSEFPPVRSLDLRPNNLPVQLTSFVGRHRELRELRDVLRQTRLLTMTGAGGTGKTRLSIQLAAEAADDFDDGVFFCPLATVSDPARVPPAISESLKLQEIQGDKRPPLGRLVDHLRTRRTLLVLDNFEQVLDAAPTVAELLKSAEDVKVVITSRASLRIYGEREFPVPPLALPDPKHLPDIDSLSQYEAVALFIQRAVTAKSDFKVTNTNAPAIAEICARLDGLPLAIELAAARIRVLSPEAMLARLGHRLKLLVGGSRDLPARQRTLRQTIEWSYDLLDDAEKNLFVQLGAFVGSFSLDEAEKICMTGDSDVDVLDGITSLLDKSLLRTVQGESPADRYYILETIREYAVEKLQRSPVAEMLLRRHAEAYTELAEAAAREIHTVRQRQWMDRLERDHDNLRAAHDWAVEHRAVETALRISTALWRLWQMRGHLREGRRRIEEALALSGPEDRSVMRASTLQAAGNVAYWQDDRPAQNAYQAEALELWREIGDKAGLAGALYDAGFGGDWSNFQANRPLFEEALAIYRELGDRHGEARVRWALAVVHIFAKEYSEAARELHPAIAVFREMGDDFMLSWSLHELAFAAVMTGKAAEAQQHATEVLRLGASARDVSLVLFALENLSRIALQQGEMERAVRLRAVVTNVKRQSGVSLVDAAAVAVGLEAVEDQVPIEGRLAEVWAEGEGMALEKAIQYALREEG